MAEQHSTDRTDDADARGEHDYGTARNKDATRPLVSPIHREPNTYVAGEHGTQQVAAPSPSSSAKREGEDDPQAAHTGDK